ncbi:MAG: hypothetical protein KTR32_03300 [Granulosicoccus sp.]|nr:hypothetical protein [Granulosicoccus sp.]
MKAAIRNIALATAFFASTLTAAEFATNGDAHSLDPLQAHTIAMADYTAVVYYTLDNQGDYQIVTTVGPNPGVNGQASQHQISLSQGQSWSLDLDSGSDTGVINFSVQNGALVLASR